MNLGIMGRALDRLKNWAKMNPSTALGQDLVTKDAPDVPASPNFGQIEQLFFASGTQLFPQLYGVPFPYKQHVWVYACVNAIAQNIAGVPLNFYTGTKKDKRLVESGPLVSLFETPNPMMSGYQLLEATMIFMGIRGESIWIMERPHVAALPEEIWPFHPSRFQQIVGENGLIRGWIYRNGSKQIPLLPHEVLFLRYFNPYDGWSRGGSSYDVYRGLSPISVAALGIEQDHYAAQYNANFFKNGAQLGGFLETDENLMPEEFDRILAQFNDRHQGVNKAHMVGLLEGGLKYKNASISQKDMDFLEGRKYNREEIINGIYKIPKGELGLEDDTGSYAKDRTRRKLFWETCLDPKMVLLEMGLWSQLCKALPGQIWPEFDRKSIPALQEDRDLLLGQAGKLWAMGYPANVVNEYLDLGLPEIEGGNIGYLPFNLQPAGSAATPPPAKSKAEPEKAKVVSIETVHPLALPPAIARRDAKTYWQNYNKLRSALEEKFQGKIKRYFYEQRKAQLQRITDMLGEKTVQKEFVDDLLFDLPQANEKLQKLSWGLWLNTGQEAGQALYGELGFDISDFVLQDTAAIEALKAKLIKVTEINDLTREKLRETLSEGLENLESAGQLQQRVRETFNFIESRSLTIARTETGQAMGIARDEAMGQLKVQTIEWGTAGDGEVRDSHSAQAGMRRKRGQVFPNGCRYPCDPQAAAGEIISCRCVGIPILED